MPALQDYTSQSFAQEQAMKFVEMSGKTLLTIVSHDEMRPDDLARVGVTEESIVRINLQGDIELRRPRGWDVIGGLLGDFRDRVKRQTGLDWV